jgi:hypothetical protein
VFIRISGFCGVRAIGGISSMLLSSSNPCMIPLLRADFGKGFANMARLRTSSRIMLP